MNQVGQIRSLSKDIHEFVSKDLELLDEMNENTGKATEKITVLNKSVQKLSQYAHRNRCAILKIFTFCVLSIIVFYFIF